MKESGGVMSQAKLLIVDDDPLVRQSLQQMFMDDFEVTLAASGPEALAILKSATSRFDAIILDIKMAKMDGLETAGHIQKIDPEVPIIFYTGFPGDYAESQIDQKYHPFDYVVKNERPGRLMRAVKNATEMHRLKSHTLDLIRLAREQYRMVGKSAAMLDLFQTIERIAQTDAKVMILGPTGSGKEMVARAIHHRSRRVDRRLAILSSSRRQTDLIEAELFGHLRGAFTSAIADRIGLFEYANGGTLFLDEIGDLDIATQAKLLRVLESGEMQRIGSPEIIKVDVRIICATHHDLKKMVERGEFREDLYYRLKGVTIALPALKDRREDIPDLIDYIVDNHCQKNGYPLKVFEPAARDYLVAYDWPGNIRQLSDTVQSLCDLSASSYISLASVVQYLESATEVSVGPRSYNDQLRTAKRDIIIGALARNNHNISAAARELQLDRSNLHKTIRELGINVVGSTTREP